MMKQERSPEDHMMLLDPGLYDDGQHVEGWDVSSTSSVWYVMLGASNCVIVVLTPSHQTHGHIRQILHQATSLRQRRDLKAPRLWRWLMVVRMKLIDLIDLVDCGGH